MAVARNADDLANSIGGPRAVFILLVVAMTLFGFVMIYSASAPSAVSEGTTPMSYLLDQMKYAALGAVAAFAAWKIPYKVWLSWFVYVIWGAGLALVLLTMVSGAGGESWGAQRWLVLGPVSMQPSEFMKIALVLVGAKIISDWRSDEIDFNRALVYGFVFVVAPMAIIFVTQSDLGTTMIIAAGILAVLWLGEVDWKIIVGIIVVAILFALAATFTSSYRSNRLLFLNPWDDGKGGYGAGYQIIHSYYAFSQGGLFGVGIGNSTEKYLYLPESETDFIYSIIGEELGMFGALLVILAFLGLAWAGLKIARHADDLFGCMVAGSLTIMIVFQAFLNMSSAMGAFPTTGKPLPFISSGGSSLIATFIMVGLILSVGSQSAGAAPLFGSRSKGDVYDQRRDGLRVVRSADSLPFLGGTGTASGTGLGFGSADASKTKSKAGKAPGGRFGSSRNSRR